MVDSKRKKTIVTTKHVKLINEIGQLNVSSATIARMLELSIYVVAKYRVKK